MDLKFINNYIDVKLLLITVSLTVAYLFMHSKNNFILKKKMINNINDDH